MCQRGRERRYERGGGGRDQGTGAKEIVSETMSEKGGGEKGLFEVID